MHMVREDSISKKSNHSRNSSNSKLKVHTKHHAILKKSSFNKKSKLSVMTFKFKLMKE